MLAYTLSLKGIPFSFKYATEMKQNGFDSMRITLFSFTNLFNTTDTCERLIFKFSLIKATVVWSNSPLLQHTKIYANIFSIMLPLHFFELLYHNML